MSERSSERETRSRDFRFYCGRGETRVWRPRLQSRRDVAADRAGAERWRESSRVLKVELERTWSTVGCGPEGRESEMPQAFHGDTWEMEVPL